MRLKITATAFVIGIVLLIAGCGGGSGGSSDDTANVSTGTTTGRLETATLAPRGGSAFISKYTTFQILWSGGNTPPPNYTVALKRYLEPRGSQTRSIGTQKIDVNRQNNDFVWNLKRRDNFELDRSGIYYIELNAPGSVQQQYAYMVDDNRSVSIPGEVTRGETLNPGSNGLLTSVQISPNPGTCFISKQTKFQLRWSKATPPPAQFTVELRRYKEALGGESRTDEEQKISVNQEGGTSDYVYDVGRRDNFDLDQSGVYYLALRAAGQDAVYAVYIVTDN